MCVIPVDKVELIKENYGYWRFKLKNFSKSSDVKFLRNMNKWGCPFWWPSPTTEVMHFVDGSRRREFLWKTYKYFQLYVLLIFQTA